MYVWELYNNFSLSQLNANFAEVSGKYLTANKTVYVATTGSDVTGDGTSGKPYKTITMGVNSIPKALNGFDGTVFIANGTYTESLICDGFTGGRLTIQSEANGTVTINGYLSINNCQEVCLRSSSGTSTYIFNNTTFTVGTIYVSKNSFLFTLSSDVYINNDATCRGLSVATSSSVVFNTTLSVSNASYGIYTSENSNVDVYNLIGSGNVNGIRYSTGSSVAWTTNTLSATTPYIVGNGVSIPSTISETPTPSNLGTVTTILAQRNCGTCRFKLNALSGTWTGGTSYTICDLTATFSPSVQLDKEVVLRTVGGTYYYGTLTITTAGVVSITPRSNMSALSTLIDETFII